jgi:hypothetical protein
MIRTKRKILRNWPTRNGGFLCQNDLALCQARLRHRCRYSFLLTLAVAGRSLFFGVGSITGPTAKNDGPRQRRALAATSRLSRRELRRGRVNFIFVRRSGWALQCVRFLVCCDEHGPVRLGNGELGIAQLMQSNLTPIPLPACVFSSMV